MVRHAKNRLAPQAHGNVPLRSVPCHFARCQARMAPTRNVYSAFRAGLIAKRQWFPQARKGRQYHGTRNALRIGGSLLCQPFGLLRTKVPADRGSGSHGSHCIGPSGLSSHKACPLAVVGMLGTCLSRSETIVARRSGLVLTSMQSSECKLASALRVNVVC